MTDKPAVQIYVDGAALPKNPGHGGSGVVLITEVNGALYTKAFGVYLGERVTNNEAELYAAIDGLRALKKPCTVTLFSDSQYLINTMTDGWRRRTNHHLWEQLDTLDDLHSITWRWVKGHNGDEFNELAHELAERAANTRKDVTDAD